jgi:hypothetical protein
MWKRMSWVVVVGLIFAAPALGRATEASGSEHEGSRPFRMPPREAQDACASLSLDATCSFTFDGRAHQGTCRRGPEGQGPVACAPDRGPRPGQQPGTGAEGRW